MRKNEKIKRNYSKEEGEVDSGQRSPWYASVIGGAYKRQGVDLPGQHTEIEEASIAAELEARGNARRITWREIRAAKKAEKIARETAAQQTATRQQNTIIDLAKNLYSVVKK